MKISWRSVKWFLRYYDFRFAVLISGGHLGFWSEAKLDWFWLCPMREWSFGENFVMIGQTVSDISRFKCLALISGRHLGFSAKPEVSCFFWFLMRARSYGENFITIGQRVSNKLRCECFGAHFRPPSWIFRQTGSALLSLVSNDGTKLRRKFHDDRSNSL